MRLFQVFMITALLIAGIPSLATAAVGAKSLRGLFSSDECEVVPELLGAWTSPGVTYSVRESHHNKYWILDRDEELTTGKKQGSGRLRLAHNNSGGIAIRTPKSQRPTITFGRTLRRGCKGIWNS